MDNTMDIEPSANVHRIVPEPTRSEPLIPNAVLGTVIFIGCEAMLFAGFISAYTIARASVPVWPPVGQPRLPVEATAVTTVMLLVSGALMWWAGRRYAEGPRGARAPLLGAVGLGAAFVGLQGVEWVRLVGEGLTLWTSAHAAFFYLIVGVHALHALGGLAVIGWQARRLVNGTLDSDSFWASRLFWYFVVLLWPLLYWKVYL